MNLSGSTKIAYGPDSTVATACTIVIGANSSLEVKQLGMDFAGPLTIQSTQKTKVIFENSPWRAPDIQIA